MNELIVNLHMHTRFSDGSSTHEQIIEFALKSNVDVLIITDHNVFSQGLEGYFRNNARSLLVLGGEEVHDASRIPQKNHLLALGTTKSHHLTSQNPQSLINSVISDNGTAFLAHPVDPELKSFGEDDISWVDWEIEGYTGLELWNGLSELKSVLKHRLHGAFLSFFPQLLAHAPLQRTRDIWDSLLSQGLKVFAIGGADAHALPFRLGFIQRFIFPYPYHFAAINTHILVDQELDGNVIRDKRVVMDAFRSGMMFVGYDLPASTRGFTFNAIGKKRDAGMGETIQFDKGIEFSIHLPSRCRVKLIRNGEVNTDFKGSGSIKIPIHVTGVYRLECYKNYLGKERGWIFSNPIWVE